MRQGVRLAEGLVEELLAIPRGQLLTLFRVVCEALELAVGEVHQQHQEPMRLGSRGLGGWDVVPTQDGVTEALEP